MEVVLKVCTFIVRTVIHLVLREGTELNREILCDDNSWGLGLSYETAFRC